MAIRLLLVSAFPPNPQGEANYAGQFLAALAALDVSGHYCVAAQRFEQESGPEVRPNVLRIMRRSGWRRHMNALRVLFTALRLRPNVIHLQSPVIPEYGGKFGEPMLPVLLVLRLLRIRVVITLHSTWLEDDLIALCREKRLSRVMTSFFIGYYKFVIRTFVRVAHGFMILTAGENSPAAQQFCREYGISPEKVRNEPHPCPVVKCGPDEQEAAKRILGLSGMDVISAFGFMREDKGFHVLVEAFERLSEEMPGTALVIGGRAQRASDQIYVEQLKRRCAEGGDRCRIRFLDGYLMTNEVATILDASDVFVIPYLRALGASGPAHHALGRGKAIVLSSIGQNLGLNDNCMMVPAGDPTCLYEALRTLLSDRQELQRRMRLARRYATGHTWASMAASYIAYYNCILSSTKRAKFKFMPTEPSVER